MKILMWGRADLFNGGGDQIQIENTAEELRKLGVEVDVSTSLETDPTSYDLVHVFQLDWAPESNLYARKAKSHKKPLVLSPIHHSVKEVKDLTTIMPLVCESLPRRFLETNTTVTP